MRMDIKKDQDYWITAKGTRLLIAEMDIMHIFNTVRMLKREKLPVPKAMKKRYKLLKQQRPELWL